MSGEARPLIELTEEALSVLNERLGVVGTMRFLAQFSLGHGNYTEERKTLFEGLTLADIVSRIRAMRRADGPKQADKPDER